MGRLDKSGLRSGKRKPGMKSIFSNKYSILAIRIFIAFIFIFSGAEKIANPSAFSDSITNYKIFPLFSVNFIAIFIPWLELITGVLLLFGIWIKENALIINTLLCIFILLVAIAVFRGLDINCGCFGTKYAQKVGFLKIGENILLMFVTYLLYKFGGEKEKNEN